MKVKKEDMRLYAVTDRTWLKNETLAEQVEKALKGGATFVQLREKHLSDAAFLAEAKEIRALCRNAQVPFVINDNVEIALACEADGVHVGQEDCAAAKARMLLGPDKLIGVSAHSVEEALEAQKNGADYLGVGAAFPTGTKGDANVISHETIRKICAAVTIPVVAIGGINETNIAQLAGTGIDGVAVISGLFAKEDIEGAARKLRTLSEEITEKTVLPGQVDP